MSATPATLVTRFDHYRLFRSLDGARQTEPGRTAPAEDWETSEIVMTHFDHDRLWAVRNRAGERVAIDALEAELDRAVLVRPEDVPPDVVTMNSRVEIEDLDSGERTRITLVFPELADASEGRISVLAPMGMAILGCQEGRILGWETPGGLRRLCIRRILFQPEAAGRFDL